MSDSLFDVSQDDQTDDSNFEYRVKRQRRKTLAVHVLEDGAVEVRAPKWVPARELAHFVEQRSVWIIEQRRKALVKHSMKPAYRDGERHYFLGQAYPLAISSSGRNGLCSQGQLLELVVRSVEEDQVENALYRWYRQQALEHFEERLFACYEAFPDWFQDKFPMPELVVRKMKRRWGSCSSRAVITLNVTLIKMPVACIDYVVVHELCHLHAFHHGKAFYALLSSIMPDWKEREAMIEAFA